MTPCLAFTMVLCPVGWSPQLYRITCAFRLASSHSGKPKQAHWVASKVRVWIVAAIFVVNYLELQSTWLASFEDSSFASLLKLVAILKSLALICVCLMQLWWLNFANCSASLGSEPIPLTDDFCHSNHPSYCSEFDSQGSLTKSVCHLLRTFGLKLYSGMVEYKHENLSELERATSQGSPLNRCHHKIRQL